MMEEYGHKYRIALHIDGPTYALLAKLRTRLGLKTPNHAALWLLIRAINQLQDAHDPAAQEWQEAKMAELQYRKERLSHED